MNELLRCELALNKVKSLSVRFWPKTDLQVKTLEEFTDSFKCLTTEDQEIIMDGIDKEMGMKLLGYSSISAAHAIDTKDEKWIEVALMAHVIENFREDYRENSLRLASISYANSLISTKSLRELISDLRPIMNYNAHKELMKFQININNSIERLKDYNIKTTIKNGKTRFVH
jgi:hypothetical protein